MFQNTIQFNVNNSIPQNVKEMLSKYYTRLYYREKRVYPLEELSQVLEHDSEKQKGGVELGEVKLVRRDINEIFDIKDYEGNPLKQLRAILAKYNLTKNSQEMIRDMRDGYA